MAEGDTSEDPQDDDGLAARVALMVADALEGTDWKPAGDAVLTDCLIIMGWTTIGDGCCDTSYLRTGTIWGAEGMLRKVLRSIEQVSDGYGWAET